MTIIPTSPPSRLLDQLLDQLLERLRYRHYSLSTEKLYVYRVRFFIRFMGCATLMK
nr:phage integrase N-terminal SAM-like domain-containing protein [Rhodoferax koreense]